MDFSSTLVLICREGMGEGPADLRLKLLKTWLDLLEANGLCPGVVAFYTDGVKLLLEGSPLLAEIQALEARGARLIACKSCLDYFGVADRLRAGVVGGMGDIQAAMVLAAKVIPL